MVDGCESEISEFGPVPLNPDRSWPCGVVVQWYEGQMVRHHLEFYPIQVGAVHLHPCQDRQTLSLNLPIPHLCLGERPAVVDHGPVLRLPVPRGLVCLGQSAG